MEEGRDNPALAYIMNEKKSQIRIGKNQYDLVFTVQALLEINENAGGIEEIGKKLEKGDLSALRDYAWILALLINQGLALKGIDTGKKYTPVTEQEILLRMTPGELIQTKSAIGEAINRGMSINFTVNEDVDEVLEEIKN